ncbi:HAMP domain-containing protein [Falsiroseomonas selenitidurans]|uniref:HAMP domain-containing protein n=1 Tax=Falsiroseomonas selenitidurans TaxID=2716335 RepID=A0ABX1E7R9_9PROT|nr:HAMP domain-containing protein [Falsiroseomonas selenitidurans]NKC33241.1 HAMP domain-containing protein [Falsiroseomonas selenitidurans]
MCPTFRHGLDRFQRRADLGGAAPAAPADAGSGRLAWCAGLGALGALCLAAALLLPPMPAPERDSVSPKEALSRLAPPPPAEPATLAGMDRALRALEGDPGRWQLLMAPDGPAHPVAPPQRAGRFALGQAAESPRPEPRAEPLGDPGQVALIALALTLAAATLLAGIAALLLERLLLAPYRALRQVALAMAEGDLHIAVPGTARHDEAGALARALERLRQASLAEGDPARLDTVTPEQAAARILAAADSIERVAAAAVLRGLEAGMAAGPGTPDQVALAQGARRLAEQVVTIRGAAETAGLVLARMDQGAASSGTGTAGPVRAMEPAG